MSNIIHGYTKPVVADFTLLNNAVTGTADDSVEGIHWYEPAGGGENLKLLVVSTPSTPWRATGHITNVGTWVYALSYGMAYRQSSNGYMFAFHNYTWGTKVNPRFYKQNYTDYTTPASSTWLSSYAVWDLGWFRLEDNGTNRISSISLDGVHWTVLITESRTTFLTADQVGFITNPATQNSYLTIDHFKLEAG